MPPRSSSRASRPGFSLVEALMGVTVTTVAGAALLTALGAAVRSSTDAMHVAVGRGMAEQLMDEIAATRFPATVKSSPSGTTRDGFDDIDDYAGWSEVPPADRHGRVLGTEGHAPSGTGSVRPPSMRADARFIERFARSVEVQRIAPDASSGWTTTTQHTGFRRVVVRVTCADSRGNPVPVAELTRIFSHVAAP